MLWDFRGPDASEIAKHHARHLADFIKKESLELNITGTSDLTDLHAVAYMVVEEKIMMQIRDALLPHRAEVYEGNKTS